MPNSVKDKENSVNNKIKKRVFQGEKTKKVNTRATYLLSNKLPFDVREAFKAARTNLMFALADNQDKCKVILVSSAIPSEGKTTTSINLAMSFAMTEARTLIIDGDLRKPRLHTTLKADNSIGLTNVLAGFVNVNEAIKRHESGLDYMTSGHTPPNPTELLSSTKMSELLKTLSESYDYIFIDTPPLAVVADASALVKSVTGVVIVARYRFTTRENVARAVSILNFAEAKILGIILNDAESYHSVSYKSGRKLLPYKKGYGYGYGKYGYGRYGYGYGKYGYGYGGYGGYGYGGYGYGYGSYGYGEEIDSENDSKEKSIEDNEEKNSKNNESKAVNSKNK